MAENPKYVRLSAHASRGMRADVKGSGWSISGRDVLPFPKRSDEKKFVRSLLNKSVLESASRAEYEEVHGDDDKLVSEDAVGHQEHRIHEAAAARAEAAAAEREFSESESEEDDDDDEEDDGEEGGEGDNEVDAEEALAKVAAENAKARAKAAAPVAKKATKAKKAASKKGARAK
jgi:hypothetical protein